MKSYTSAGKKKLCITAPVHGMCGGVFAALQKLDEMHRKHGKVYVFRELVHNRAVTEELSAKQICFVNDPSEIPDDSAVVIGAHGVSREIEKILREKASHLQDASCPLVKKLHRIASALNPAQQLVICGRQGHPEVDGIAGNSGTGEVYIVSSPEAAAGLPELPEPVFISQTTVDHQEVESVLAVLKKRFPGIKVSSGVCDASRSRQKAVIELAGMCDAVLVIGSGHSSNARRLCEIAAKLCGKAFLIDNAAEIPWSELEDICRVGVTSGASTPEYLFTEVVSELESAGFSCGGDADSGTPDT